MAPSYFNVLTTNRSEGQIWSGMAFVSALLLYATLSGPFPSAPGVVEVIIACLLALFVTLPTGIVVMSGGFTIYQKYEIVPMWLHLGFFLSLWWGLFNGGIVHAWHVTDIVRDLIPCVYMFVPLLLLPAMQRSRWNWAQLFPWLLSIVGVILSIRFFYVVQISPLDIGKMSYFDNFLYLAYDPSVTFAAIFLPIMAIHTWKSSSLMHWISSLMMLAGGFMALASLMAIAQRAPVGLSVLSFFVYFLLISWKSVKKILLFLIIMACISYLAQDLITSSYQLLMNKQETYGMNGKADEFIAVLQDTSRSVHALLFGIGWGGLFYDPTYGEEVSFTHSAVTFFLLKGGVLGLTIFLLYLIWIFSKLFRSLSMERLPYILAATVPVMIGLLFQPSFKTLTYGMIIAFLCLMDQKSLTRSSKA
ncbi:hypothetical protein [Paenibacillus sediminis]|uniref:O-antigen ligase domain-containing protein n=1 Tax=Paenibacillus sediminis TaxID=664909 RepID=A0ABS4H4J9_9BACL|nr:hypothetical protein [Paenibacillus sediminis]